MTTMIIFGKNDKHLEPWPKQEIYSVQVVIKARYSATNHDASVLMVYSNHKHQTYDVIAIL